jgi:hypothetical protein
MVRFLYNKKSELLLMKWNFIFWLRLWVFAIVEYITAAVFINFFLEVSARQFFPTYSLSNRNNYKYENS